MGKTAKFKFTKSFETIIRSTPAQLKQLMYQHLSANYKEVTNVDGFLYAKGEIPVMFIAHMDTVHKEPVTSLCVSSDGVLMSPQGIGGDDRCGIYIIDTIVNYCISKDLPLPHVLFTEEEEVGCVGAKKFVKATKPEDFDLKYIIEYDRKGNNDCVFYSCDNKEFTDWVETFGWKKAYGSCSDISHIAPHLGVAAVNLSSGYYNPHRTEEYIVMDDVYVAILRGLQMMEKAEESVKYEYIAAKTTYTSYGGNYNYNKYNSYGSDLTEYDDYYYGNTYGGYPSTNIYSGNIAMSSNKTTAEGALKKQIDKHISKTELTEKEAKEIKEYLTQYMRMTTLKPIDFDDGYYLYWGNQYVIEGDYFISQFNTVFVDTPLGIPKPIYTATLYTGQGVKAQYETLNKKITAVEQLTFYSPTLYDNALKYLKNKYPDKYQLLLV